MPANERKFKSCQNGHVIGEIKRIIYYGANVKSLLLFNQSIAGPDVPEELPPLRAKIIGSAIELCCTICASKVNWGQEAFDALMSRYPRDKIV